MVGIEFEAFHWRLACDLQMSWTHSLYQLLVRAGRLADYYFLPLCTGLKVLLRSHDSIFVQRPGKAKVWCCHPHISAIMLASVILFLNTFSQSILCIYLPSLVKMNPWPSLPSSCWYMSNSTWKNVVCTQDITIIQSVSNHWQFHPQELWWTGSPHPSLSSNSYG